MSEGMTPQQREHAESEVAFLRAELAMLNPRFILERRNFEARLADVIRQLDADPNRPDKNFVGAILRGAITPEAAMQAAEDDVQLMRKLAAAGVPDPLSWLVRTARKRRRSGKPFDV